jgi:hypothetical protein
MNQVFVITRSGELARSIVRYFRYTQSIETDVMYPLMDSSGDQYLALHSFQRIANWVESKARSDEGVNLRNALVFIDLFDKRLERFEDLDPMAINRGNWSATVAMLIMAFPEIHWVLNTPYQTPDNSLFACGHLLGRGNNLAKIIDLRTADYTPLFDPAGLRLRIRKKISATPDSSYVPLRHHVAAAIDEEDDYAYFNAYMAYRLGYRAHVISSYLMMHEVLWRPDADPSQKAQDNGRNIAGSNGQPKSRDEHVELIFEDLYLNFPDHFDPELHLSNLEKRTVTFKALDGQPSRKQMRALVTVGHDIPYKKDLKQGNEDYQKKWEARGDRKFSNVLKPVSGYFHLLEQSGVQGYASGYIWPPLIQDEPPDTNDPSLPVDTSSRRTFYTGHSAPGRLLEIAERLLCRTELNSEHVHTVAQAVYGATLALEAQEYLGHRTPTTSLQALALKHKFEVNAECLFYGVGTNKEVKKRFNEIEKEVRSISRWLNPENRTAAQLDAELSIVSKLMLIFRQNYQFDEEQECLKRLRKLNNKLWSRRVRTVRYKQMTARKHQPQIKFWEVPYLFVRGAFGWLFHWPICLGRGYVDGLINSLASFALAITAWVIVLSVLYGLLCGCTAALPPEHQTISPVLEPLRTFNSTETHLLPAVQKILFYSEQGLMHAITAFFGLQPPHELKDLEEYGPYPLIVTIFAIALGFGHLGIFISHVYSVISRR